MSYFLAGNEYRKLIRVNVELYTDIYAKTFLASLLTRYLYKFPKVFSSDKTK